MKDNKVRFLAQGAMIAAVYVALTVVFAPISFSEIQVRVAEALTILPVFTPAAAPWSPTSSSDPLLLSSAPSAPGSFAGPIPSWLRSRPSWPTPSSYPSY